MRGFTSIVFLLYWILIENMLAINIIGVLTQYTIFVSSILLKCHIYGSFAHTRDLKSLAFRGVPVQVWPRAPFNIINKSQK